MTMLALVDNLKAGFEEKGIQVACDQNAKIILHPGEIIESSHALVSLQSKCKELGKPLADVVNPCTDPGVFNWAAYFTNERIIFWSAISQNIFGKPRQKLAMLWVGIYLTHVLRE